MKKVNVLKLSALALAVGFGGNAMAAGESVDPTAGGADLEFTAETDGSGYVQTDFTYRVSSLVTADTDENAVNFAVLANHSQGRFSFAGDASGGSVASCEEDANEDGFGSTTAQTDVDDPCNGRS